MSGLELLWLLFLVVALQPVLRQRILQIRRRQRIAAIEAKRRSRLILLVHRQETMSLLGFPLVRYIDVDDAEQIIRAIEMTDAQVPIDLVLHTPGGLALASLQIARAIHGRKGRVTVFVPHYAMSGGTMIALAADEIVMSQHAVLGPVDPQVGQYPAASLLSLLRMKPIKEISDETLILADQAAKAVHQVQTQVRELLDDKLPAEEAVKLSELLTQGTWTHDHPITFEEAKSIGLSVSADIPREILELMDFFPQPVRRTPSVAYSPEPRHEQPAAGRASRSAR